MNFTIGSITIAGIVGLAIFSMNSCAVRQHEFKIACIDRGGIYLDRQGTGADCIIAGRKTTDLLKSE